MTTLTTWSRPRDLDVFDALVRRSFGPSARVTGFTPAAEVQRDGDDAVVTLELPGLDVASDVSVQLDRGRLVVAGERKDVRTDEQKGRSLREVRYGSFRRSFTLPEHVTSEALSASYDAGILTVRVSGAYAGREPQQVTITVGTPTPSESTQS